MVCVLHCVALRCVVWCCVCWWMYVGQSAVVCKGMLYKKKPFLESRGRRHSTKHIFQVLRKNVEPRLESRVPPLTVGHGLNKAEHRSFPKSSPCHHLRQPNCGLSINPLRIVFRTGIPCFPNGVGLWSALSYQRQC